MLALMSCAVVGTLLGLMLPEPDLAPISILRRPYSTPLRLRARVGQWIPRKPTGNWAWKIEELVFGRRKVLNVFAEILKIPVATAVVVSDFTPGQPEYSNANGLQVWLLPYNELKSLRRHLKETPGTESINGARITMADGMSASLYSGESALINGSTNQVGLEVDYFARVRSVGTDLFASVQLTEAVTNEWNARGELSRTMSVQTNLDIALRLQIPKGSGVFLLNGRPGEAHGKRVGVIIDPP
jgi:hypothetical protein